MSVVDEQNKYCENKPSVHNQGKLIGHCEDFEMEKRNQASCLQPPSRLYLYFIDLLFFYS